MAIWQSRIVGHEKVAPDQLLANPFNFRMHPQTQRDALAGSIEAVGFIRSVTVNITTGHVIDGHERVWQALQSEQPFIDVEYVQLTEAEEKLALAVFDPISEMATVDAGILQELLQDVQTGNEALGELLGSLAEENGIVPPGDAEQTGARRAVIRYSDAEAEAIAIFLGDGNFSPRRLGRRILARIKAAVDG